MLFSSATFLFFFLPLSIVLHFLAGLFPKRGRITLQNLLLIGFSLVFFAWANVDAVRILLWLILLNYGIGLISLRFRKILLAGVILNILTLFYYKYPNTAMGWWSDLTFTTRTWDILVPLGISFIVFHNISYLLDIYWGKTQVNKNPIEVALYIVFFPKLIQGPIVKYYDMEGELKNRETTLSDMSTGAERFIIGLAKKVLVADILAATTDDIFGRMYTGIDVPTAWLGVLLYALVIYTDFSGYSDMAIGLGRFFGFHFQENFRFPYSSVSVSEFWRRWHISLGSWFREYLYFPLGGSRKGNVYFNLFVVFLITGIWHGSSLIYWFWGIAHGLCVMIERYISNKKWYSRIPKSIKWFFTFFVVSMGWIVFQTGSFTDFKGYIKDLLGLNPQPLTYHFAYFLSNRVLFLIFICAVCLVLLGRKGVQEKLKKWNETSKVFQAVKYVGLCVLFALSLMGVVSSTYSPFIYFQF